MQLELRHLIIINAIFLCIGLGIGCKISGYKKDAVVPPIAVSHIADQSAKQKCQIIHTETKNPDGTVVSQDVLSALADIHQEAQQIVKVQVITHTDYIGSIFAGYDFKGDHAKLLGLGYNWRDNISFDFQTDTKFNSAALFGRVMF